MKHFQRISIAACLLLATGCAAASHQNVPFPTQDLTVTCADRARIYFVRDDAWKLQSRALRVFDGDTEIGTLTSDTYLCWERGGGRTVGRAYYEAIDPSRGSVDGIGDLDCRSGRAYYFNVEVSPEDGKPAIHRLPASEGRRLVAERKRAGDE